jgi:hypothetical protein
MPAHITSISQRRVIEVACGPAEVSLRILFFGDQNGFLWSFSWSFIIRPFSQGKSLILRTYLSANAGSWAIGSGIVRTDCCCSRAQILSGSYSSAKCGWQYLNVKITQKPRRFWVWMARCATAVVA